MAPGRGPLVVHAGHLAPVRSAARLSKAGGSGAALAAMAAIAAARSSKPGRAALLGRCMMLLAVSIMLIGLVTLLRTPQRRGAPPDSARSRIARPGSKDQQEQLGSFGARLRQRREIDELMLSAVRIKKHGEAEATADGHGETTVLQERQPGPVESQRRHHRRRDGVAAAKPSNMPTAHDTSRTEHHPMAVQPLTAAATAAAQAAAAAAVQPLGGALQPLMPSASSSQQQQLPAGAAQDKLPVQQQQQQHPTPPQQEPARLTILPGEDAADVTSPYLASSGAALTRLQYPLWWHGPMCALSTLAWHCTTLYRACACTCTLLRMSFKVFACAKLVHCERACPEAFTCHLLSLYMPRLPEADLPPSHTC
jgi:hypothetical protein